MSKTPPRAAQEARRVKVRTHERNLKPRPPAPAPRRSIAEMFRGGKR